jgi:hypothetical protein
MLAPVPIRGLLHLLPAQKRNPTNQKTENPRKKSKSTNQNSLGRGTKPSPLDVLSERQLIYSAKLRLRSSGGRLRRGLGLHGSWRGSHGGWRGSHGIWRGSHGRRRRRLHRDRGGLHGSTRGGGGGGVGGGGLIWGKNSHTRVREGEMSRLRRRPAKGTHLWGLFIGFWSFL